MITSPSNPKIKRLAALRNKAKARREEDVFLIEGIRMFCEVPTERISEIYLTEAFLDKIERDTAARLNETAREKLRGLRYEIVSGEVFARVSDTVTPQGILCVVKCFHPRMEDFLEKENAYYLMLEDIQDPGNLGTMLRTAEGAGIQGIILSRGCADIYNPKVVRATMGSIFRMPFLYQEDFVAAEKAMVSKGFRIYAAALDGAVSYAEMDYEGKVALLVGNEGNGLSQQAVSNATQAVFIPMEGQVESLNASVSAAVLMYHGKYKRDGGR